MEIPFEIRRRKGQKHVIIRIQRDGRVVVSAGTHTEMREIEKHIRQKQKWIEKHRSRILERLESWHPLKQVLFKGDFIQVETMKAERSSVRVVKTGLLVKGRDQSQQMNALQRWMTRKAKEIIPPLVHQEAKKLGVKIEKVIFRNQRTRWGSSSELGNISLNWRIIMLPEHLMTYLVDHEAAHQIEMNHSRDFWNIVKSLDPDYKEHDKGLKQLSDLLGLFRQ
jgi:predicted metal-dependent hydrolase